MNAARKFAGGDGIPLPSPPAPTQPRENAVPCHDCRRPTWEPSARCLPCSTWIEAARLQAVEAAPVPKFPYRPMGAIHKGTR